MPKNAAFATGDLVKLKSGGPVMTVQESTQAGTFKCQWFAGKKLEFGFFQAESLEKTELESK